MFPTVIVAIVLVALLVLVVYVWMALALAALLAKVGGRPWHAWVPVLRWVAAAERAGVSRMGVLAARTVALLGGTAALTGVIGEAVADSAVPAARLALVLGAAVWVLGTCAGWMQWIYGAGFLQLSLRAPRSMSWLAAVCPPLWASMLGWGRYDLQDRAETLWRSAASAHHEVADVGVVPAPDAQPGSESSDPDGQGHEATHAEVHEEQAVRPDERTDAGLDEVTEVRSAEVTDVRRDERTAAGAEDALAAPAPPVAVTSLATSQRWSWVPERDREAARARDAADAEHALSPLPTYATAPFEPASSPVSGVIGTVDPIGRWRAAADDRGDDLPPPESDTPDRDDAPVELASALREASVVDDATPANVEATAVVAPPGPATAEPDVADVAPVEVVGPWANPTSQIRISPRITVVRPVPQTEPHADDEDEHTIVVQRRDPWVLQVIGGGRYPLGQGRVRVGRARNAEDLTDRQRVAIRDSTRTMSKLHAELELRETTWWVRDLGSTNGTQLRSHDDSISEVGEGFTPVIGSVLFGEVEAFITHESDAQ